MGLRFFADHCVANSVINALIAAGREVFRLRDHLPADAPDPEVIEKAPKLKSLLLSLDGDFTDIVSYPPAGYKGIVALRARNHPESLPQIIALLLEYLKANPQQDHYQGKLLIVEPHQIRSRS